MLFVYTQWLAEEFLPYLEEWELSTQKRSGFSKVAKKKMLLSSQTLMGLKISG